MKKKKKNKKKILLLLLFIIILTSIFCLIKCVKPTKKYIIETDKEANIDELYIYGNHLNLNGTIDIHLINQNITDVNLLFYAKKEVRIPLNYKVTDENIYFELADKLNNGYLIDNLDIQNYNLYIETINGEEKEYYNLKNNTTYESTEYYSIRKNDEQKKMILSNKNATIALEVKKVNDKNVYDIVIDPGHGGIDPGASGNGYSETDFTYLISSKVKEKLEKHGLRVKLTRGDLSSGERLPNYGENGRVNIANESKAKYLLAIHLNSNDYNDSGLEVYTAYGVDYTFASNIASSIVNKANTNYSTNNAFKEQKGVYTRTLQDSDLRESYENAIANGYKPYDISDKTTYYFIIRETGGYMSGAYKDSRDGSPYNYYTNSNVGMESYLLELGYLTSKKDVNNLNNNLDDYVDGIVDAMLKELESNE
ncbi:MAG: N-acetylmuramoyl-L-alanine amidase [Bacilli bacterium]|nr:N-acetylmuramoyl-L-alanine amidase [Bacilli bacterium]